MRKKILGIALVVALIAIVVSGTLAFFTAEDEATNTVTYGSVEIEIYENDTATASDTMSFGKLIPIVEAVPYEDKNYFPKVVDVKNVGENTAYIRVHIGIPTALQGYLHLDLTEAGWEKQTDSAATVDGVAYTVYTYDHTAAVAPHDFTAELLQGVYLSSDVDVAEDANGNLVFAKKTDGKVTHNSGFIAHTKTAGGYTTTTINVLVAAEAIQERNFTNGTTNALNTGFGENANPWQ